LEKKINFKKDLKKDQSQPVLTFKTCESDQEIEIYRKQTQKQQQSKILNKKTCQLIKLKNINLKQSNEKKPKSTH